MDGAKEAIRTKLQEWRHQLSDEYVSEASALIAAACVEEIKWDTVRSLHVYLPNHKQKEVDTWPLLHSIWQSHAHVTTYAPIMQGSTMHFGIITPETPIKESSFGIPEPIASEEEDLQFDVVFVPVTGFNKDGYRLGYGFGHYDRFLKKVPGAITIGLAYDRTEVDFPVEAHDVPLTHIATENRFITVPSNNTRI